MEGLRETNKRLRPPFQIYKEGEEHMKTREELRAEIIKTIEDLNPWQLDQVRRFIRNIKKED